MHKDETMTRRLDPRNAWKVDGNHVYPTNDLRSHSVTDCWCRPFEDDGVIVHNSLDRRELYEQGARKMS